ncbi:MAG: DoxX family protein [Bacteroidetes bacterium]|nr:DoxX family protein [Bacteroidota bacterium]
MKTLRHLCRILVGLVFVFSGFVKGVDPLGTMYRIQDYFLAYGTEWAMPFALSLAIALCVIEFMLGISMLLNVKVRLTSYLLLLMMIFFTLVTFYDALFNPVPDCGCFGDAIKLTNWQTFFKNIILLIPTLVVFQQRNHFKGLLLPSTGVIVLVMTILIFTGFCIRNVSYLPPIDFTGWKKGTDLSQKQEKPIRFFVKYKNKKTGETKEFLSPNYPWNDTAWMAAWEFVEQRMENPEDAEHKSLKIEDASGNDLTQAFLSGSGYTFFLSTSDLAKADTAAFSQMRSFGEKVTARGATFIVLTSALPEEIEKFQASHNFYFEWYLADDVVLKTMVRSNPGLILLKGGVIVDKWSFRDFPAFEEVDKSYLSAEAL